MSRCFLVCVFFIWLRLLWAFSSNSLVWVSGLGFWFGLSFGLLFFVDPGRCSEMLKVVCLDVWLVCSELLVWLVCFVLRFMAFVLRFV